MIGDVLTTALLFEALKKKYPKCELHYVINSNTFAVVQNNPFIDKFLFVSPEIEKSKLKLYSFLKSIGREKYDVIIDAYSKISSNLMTLFSGSKQKISKYKWYSSIFYTHPIKYNTKRNTNAGLAIENRFQLLSPFSIDLSSNYKPGIFLTENELNESRHFLKKHQIDLNKPLFMIAVLGSSFNKTYPIAYMSAVIDLIVDQTKGQILFNYMPKQEQVAKEIFDMCKPHTKKLIFFNVYGKSLRSFLAITHHCAAIIGNEGGAINMAKALDVPTFTIFSPWIDKATWSIFENDQNISVHLKDFIPEIYENVHERKMKSKSVELYKKFKPEFIKNKLITFLNHITEH